MLEFRGLRAFLQFVFSCIFAVFPTTSVFCISGNLVYGEK